MHFAQRFASTTLALSLSIGAVSAQDADTVLATANGVEITLGHVVALTSRLPENFQTVDDATLFNGVIDQLIQQTLLAEKTDANGKGIALALENERRALLATTALEDISKAAITPETLQAAYDAEVGGMAPQPEFRASHILVETEEEAKELIVSLEGGVDFAELAKEKSTGPSGENGGQLGWFGLGQMVPEFEQAVLSLQVEEVSPPVMTQFGWHVLKLFETRERPVPSLEEMTENLTQTLRETAINTAIADLEEGATITRSDMDIDPASVRDASILD